MLPVPLQLMLVHDTTSPVVCVCFDFYRPVLCAAAHRLWGAWLRLHPSNPARAAPDLAVVASQAPSCRASTSCGER